MTLISSIGIDAIKAANPVRSFSSDRSFGRRQSTINETWENSAIAASNRDRNSNLAPLIEKFLLISTVGESLSGIYDFIRRDAALCTC